MSQGKTSDATYIKEQKDIKYGLSPLRERNLARIIAKQMEATGKNIIYKELV